MRWIKIVITIVLMGYVLIEAGIFNVAGRSALYAQIRNVDPVYVGLSLLLSIILNLLSSVKWHMLLQARGLCSKFGKLFAYYYIGKFFNLFLPTSVGGDVVRIYKLGKEIGNSEEATASVFVERFTGMITLTVFSLFAFVVSYKIYNVPEITISLLVCAVTIILIGWMVLDPRPMRLLSNFVTGRFAIVNIVVTRLKSTHVAIIAYTSDTRALTIAFLNSAAFYFLAVINVWVTALAFSPNIEFASIIVAVPAIMLIMNLPISIGGIGLMEFAYILIFDQFGYGVAIGFSTALLMRIKTVIDGLIGGVVYLSDKPSGVASP
ncbi:MAG: flippase-like domain-containing protein [Gammaproteobacteria bacterium]|nr:flippase-like domain-containing protein [Gammaproteobacteria bacterium]MDH3465235.1 flippase-like domain-containing protein [Gammaproteobacteria bacterium]